jgi:hypothetical protein
MVKGRQKSRWSFGWMREVEGQQLGNMALGGTCGVMLGLLIS